MLVMRSTLLLATFAALFESQQHGAGGGGGVQKAFRVILKVLGCLVLLSVANLIKKVRWGGALFCPRAPPPHPPHPHPHPPPTHPHPPTTATFHPHTHLSPLICPPHPLHHHTLHRTSESRWPSSSCPPSSTRRRTSAACRTLCGRSGRRRASRDMPLMCRSCFNTFPPLIAELFRRNTSCRCCPSPASTAPAWGAAPAAWTEGGTGTLRRRTSSRTSRLPSAGSTGAC